MVEADEAADIGPHLLVRGVKDVGPILMDLDALYFAAVYISAHVSSPLQHQAPLSSLCRLLRKDAAK